jgi:endonuclease YncB( thermonuclease family)
LCERGCAWPYTVSPNIEYVDRSRAAGEQAKREGRGVYMPDQPLPESPREHRQRRSGTDLR